MTRSTSELAPQGSPRLIDHVTSLRSALRRRDIHVADMSRAGSLEMQIGSMSAASGRTGTLGPPLIERLEGAIRPRRIDMDPEHHSRFHYFLDGTQKTVPVMRVGLAPVVVALSVAGVLHREPGQSPSLIGGSLRIGHTWIVPRDPSDPQLEALVREVEEAGIPVIDSLTGPAGERDTSLAGDYGRLLNHAFDLAGQVRVAQERDALRYWQETLAPMDPDHWLVVDGRLEASQPRAVGVVKELLTQHLTGHEAVALFDLPQGHRTTAFRFSRLPGPEDDDAERATRSARTIWYMRLWNATGQDARHSLVRIEAGNDVDSTEQIDEISRWILAERLPRATDDPRWPTLLYPIHYLERILKRRLAEITMGWPSA